MLAGLTATLVTFIAAPLLRQWLINRNVMDLPTHRSSHTIAVPRGGGVACAFGVVVGSVTAAITGLPVPWQVLLGAFALASVGFIDDRVQLPARPRLVAQILTGAFLGGTLGGPILAVIGAALTPIIVNVVNFMDGINGITGLTMVLWGGTTAVMGSATNAAGLAALGIVTLGAAMGFLPWNAPRAKMFLGDVGSYLFGTLAAGGLLLGSSEGVTVAALIAPLAIYIVDVAITLVRRAFRRARLGEAHREHIYQRLVDTFKTSHLAVAGWIAALAFVLTTLSSSAGPWNAIGIVGVLMLYLGSIPVWRLATPIVRRFARTRKETP